MNFARVTPMGLLLFFPSYPVMDKCLENWQVNNSKVYLLRRYEVDELFGSSLDFLGAKTDQCIGMWNQNVGVKTP